MKIDAAAGLSQRKIDLLNSTFEPGDRCGIDIVSLLEGLMNSHLRQKLECIRQVLREIVAEPVKRPFPLVIHHNKIAGVAALIEFFREAMVAETNIDLECFVPRPGSASQRERLEMREIDNIAENPQKRPIRF